MEFEEPKMSPWGKVRHCEKLTDWLYSAGTVTRGGFKLRKDFNEKVPKYLRDKDGWYEEDYHKDIILVIFFEQLINELVPSSFKNAVVHWGLESYVKSFKRYYPDEYKKFYNLEHLDDKIGERQITKNEGGCV